MKIPKDMKCENQIHPSYDHIFRPEGVDTRGDRVRRRASALGLESGGIGRSGETRPAPQPVEVPG